MYQEFELVFPDKNVIKNIKIADITSDKIPVDGFFIKYSNDAVNTHGITLNTD
jgi:hypothetical protein